MPNSTAVLTDATTLQATAFSDASVTKSNNSDVDLPALATEAVQHIQQAKANLQQVVANCDSGDAQRTLANDIIGTLS